MRSAIAGIVAFLAMAFASNLGNNALARETVPIVNYENRSAAGADGMALTEARVKEAIVTAIRTALWSVSEDAPGRIIASQTFNGKHTLIVEIAYDGRRYSVVYRDSINLNYFRYGATGPVIHPAYNKRVKELVDGIDAALRRN